MLSYCSITHELNCNEISPLRRQIEWIPSGLNGSWIEPVVVGIDDSHSPLWNALFVELNNATHDVQHGCLVVEIQLVPRLVLV